MNVNVSAKARDPFSAAQWHVDLKSVLQTENYLVKRVCLETVLRPRLQDQDYIPLRKPIFRVWGYGQGCNLGLGLETYF